MQQNWLNSVITQVHHLTPEGISFSGGAGTLQQQLEADFVTLLPGMGQLSVEGSDAARFLQGQLSCDLDEVNPAAGRRGVHCTPKGRAIASFILVQQAVHRFTCLLPCSALPALQRALAKYIVFSKAQLEDVTDSWAVFGLAGNSARGLIQRYGDGALPNGPFSRAGLGAGYCFQLEGETPRYLVVLPRSEAEAFWRAASQELTIADSAAWELLDIHQGIGNIVGDSSELFIPQMLNFDKLGAISFRKGCYTGQEVVARAHYRGAVKRRMRRFSAEADAPPGAGDALVAEGLSGTFVSALATGGGRIEGLVVLGEDQPAQARMALNGQDTTIITTALDYPRAQAPAE